MTDPKEQHDKAEDRAHNGQNCGNCEFFDREGGKCLRYPPISLEMERSAFPVVKETDWCGEWKPI